jgi:hypothetical protein
MKKLLMIMLLCSQLSYAQFTKAELIASGLTCSMCNLATQKQIQSLNFVDSVIPDLELNAFHIYFNQTHEINFEMIRKKVEDAGFFVAELKVSYHKMSSHIYSNPLLFFENSVLCIDKYNAQKELHIFKFIDEGYLTLKELKKYRKLKQEMVLPSNSKDILLLQTKKMYHVVEE